MVRGVLPELELAFLLAGVAERRAGSLERVRALAARCDADALADSLAARRLLPLIGARLRELAGDELPAGFAARVDTAIRDTRAAAMALEALTLRLLARLDRAGIPAVALKGPLMEERLYGELGLRQTADVDLLVAPADLGRSVELLRSDGYGPALEAVRRDGLPDLHFRLPGERLPSVELHWRIHWYEEDFSRDYLHRAVPDATGVRRPEPLDELISLLLYYARDGFHGLRGAADIAAWFDRHGAPTDFSRAREYPALVAPLQAAAVVAERVTGAPLARLVGVTRPRGRIRVATELADWTGVGERDQLAANIALVDALLSPPGGRGAFARRLVRLDPAAEAAIRSPAELIARRAVHTAKMSFRFALALWALRRRRPGSGCAEPPPRGRFRLR